MNEHKSKGNSEQEDCKKEEKVMQTFARAVTRDEIADD